MVPSTSSGKPRLLVIGQAVTPTGYARVLHSLLPHLQPTFEVLHFGINYTGEPLDVGYRIVPNHLIGDIFGRAQLPGLLAQFQPVLIFLCHDADFYAVHQPALEAYRQYHPAARVVFYCPIQWASTLPGSLVSLAGVDRLVLYTEFGRRVVQAAWHTLSVAPTPPLAVLPHGVDTTLFYPLVPADHTASRQQARARLFPNQSGLQQAFIVLNANRNSLRKRMDLTLHAFAAFARDTPEDVYLYLHMGLRDSGYDVLALAEALGIRQRLLLTTTTAEKPDVPDAHLNLIYNACDVGLNTATGEGWGLVAFEHAATGAAQLVPDHSACAELWRDTGVLLPVEDTPAAPGLVSVPGTAAALQQVYTNRELLRQLSARALAYATAARFSWQHIAAAWETLLRSLVALPHVGTPGHYPPPALSFTSQRAWRSPGPGF